MTWVFSSELQLWVLVDQIWNYPRDMGFSWELQVWPLLLGGSSLRHLQSVSQSASLLCRCQSRNDQISIYPAGHGIFCKKYSFSQLLRGLGFRTLGTYVSLCRRWNYQSIRYGVFISELLVWPLLGGSSRGQPTINQSVSLCTCWRRS